MISIIVPVYNAAEYIADTIRMVQRQTYKDWEIILVDDHSKDDSAAIIEGFMGCGNHRPEVREDEGNVYTAAEACTDADKCGKSDKSNKSDGFGDIGGARATGVIRLIRKPANEGAAKARNTGIDAARGRYIAFLDADDVWHPRKLERELEYMKERKAGFLFMSYLFGDENAVPTGKAVHVPKTLTYRQALSRTVIFTSTVLFDTEIIDKKLIYMPEIASEDTAAWWRILQAGHTAYGLDEALTIYRRPKKTLSSNKWLAVRRMWGLYRNVAGMNPFTAALYMPRWAVRATLRRLLPDHAATTEISGFFNEC